ncbi:hypothetical protein [Rufibacter sp. LB8]|uniref:hypothetical protein n=1 Tax=Rufibacter sp. LB8 TaxID=2777781 RepID=UPI00178C657F|nr:hypothetical protein [Rufibacter sp. LB8]
MDLKILNGQGLQKEVESFLREEISSEDNSNNHLIKNFFGARMYDKKDIEIKSLIIKITALGIGAVKPFGVEKIEGLLGMEGKYRLESGGAKGFLVNVKFRMDLDQESSSFKNLLFQNT